MRGQESPECLIAEQSFQPLSYTRISICTTDSNQYSGRKYLGLEFILSEAEGPQTNNGRPSHWA